MGGNQMVQRLLVAVRVTLACSLVFLNAPVVPAQEFGVVEDLYVGRHTTTPFGGIGRYQNLLIRSEELDGGGVGSGTWNRSASTSVSATNIVAPDEAASAEAITFSGSGNDTIKQISAAAAGSNKFAGSIWLKAASGTPTVRIGLLDQAGTPASTYANAVLDTTWQRFQVSKTFSTATGNVVFIIDDNSQDNSGTNLVIHAWGAQLEDVTSEPDTDAGVYTKTATSAVSTASRGVVSNTDLRMTGAQNVTFQGFSNFVTQLPIQFEGTSADDFETSKG